MSYPADCRIRPTSTGRAWHFARLVAVLDDCHVHVFDIESGVHRIVETVQVQRRTRYHGWRRWAKWGSPCQS